MNGWRTLMVSTVISGISLSSWTLPAQTPEEWRKAQEGQPLVIDQEYDSQENYEGVIPGTGNRLPRVEELKTQAGVWITWPGFIIRPDSGTRIFLQTTVPVQYVLKRKGLRVIIELNDAQVFLSNNRNPLVTEFFNTPVKEAVLKKGKGKSKKVLALVIDLKEDVLFEISQEADKDGYHYMFIDFPPNAPSADTVQSNPY